MLTELIDIRPYKINYILVCLIWGNINSSASAIGSESTSASSSASANVNASDIMHNYS